MEEDKSQGMSPILVKIGTALLVAALIAGCWFVLISPYVPGGYARSYDCDYKTLSVMKTVITVPINGKTYSISGHVFPIFTDPLTMKNEAGEVVGFAGDNWGIVVQDSHGIYVNGTCELNVKGSFAFWGEKYALYDTKGNQIGTVRSNIYNTACTIKDTKGKLIAKYTSPVYINDYSVYVYENDLCSDEAVLMIFASYVSDVRYDEENKK